MRLGVKPDGGGIVPLMRTTLALIVGAAALASATVGTAATSAVHPGLRLAAAKPLTVRGTGFVARELVTVRVRAAGTRTSKRLRAGSAGGFVVRFDRVAVDPCAISSIAAAGASGRAAAVKLPPAQCPQPPVP